MPAPASQWPSLRKRLRSVGMDMYAEAVGDAMSVAFRLLPENSLGVPAAKARLVNSVACSWMAVTVAFVGHVEKLLVGCGGLPVNELRETTLSELAIGLGALNDKSLLPSAYDMWQGPRSSGLLRVRYTYNVDRLRNYSVSTLLKLPLATVEPLALDAEVDKWIRQHVETPAPSSRARVWRVLKRRLYHYDAGVIAYRGFSRNFLLSSYQWKEILVGLPEREGQLPVALDIGAGDGSLNEPFRGLFSKIVATELSLPLVCRLRDQGLDARYAEEPLPKWLGTDSFDVVFILNVLDRCKDPEKMLRQAVNQFLRADATAERALRCIVLSTM